MLMEADVHVGRQIHWWQHKLRLLVVIFHPQTINLHSLRRIALKPSEHADSCMQDAAAPVITNCKANAADVKANLDAATKNKEALTALKAKATALTTAEAQKRQLRYLYRLSCASFYASFQAEIKLASDAPTSDQVSSSVTALIEAPGVVCSEDEKKNIRAEIKLLDEVLADLEVVIAELTVDYAGME